MSKVPPTYADLGKSARDLFDKGYNYGSHKIDFKTKSPSGVEFTVKGSSPTGSGKISGSLETKYKRPSHGLTFTEKWNTDNTLCSEIAVEDQLTKGLKTTLCTSFNPGSGKKSALLKNAFKCDYVNFTFDTDFNLSGPKLQGSAVFGYEGWLAGYQFAFDSSASKLSKSNLAMGYTAQDLQIHTAVNDCTDFSGSIYQSISKTLSTGVQVGWSTNQNETRFGIATKYDCCSVGTVNAKVDNAGQIGLGYTHKLRDGVKLTMSTLVQGKNFNAGNHQIGLGLDFEV